MDDHTLLVLLAVFVALAAIAMLIQAVSLLGLLVVARKLQARIMPIIPDIEAIVVTSRRTIEQVETNVAKIGASSTAILDITKGQLNKIDDLLNDATRRAKVQMERAEMVLDDTMTRAQETVSIIQRGVVRPIREVHGVFVGIRTAVMHWGKGVRPTVDHATSDEEMFI